MNLMIAMNFKSICQCNNVRVCRVPVDDNNMRIE